MNMLGNCLGCTIFFIDVFMCHSSEKKIYISPTFLFYSSYNIRNNTFCNYSCIFCDLLEPDKLEYIGYLMHPRYLNFQMFISNEIYFYCNEYIHWQQFLRISSSGQLLIVIKIFYRKVKRKNIKLYATPILHSFIEHEKC